MTTWDDKPNDYEHALAEIERLQEENIALIETLKHPDQVGYWQRKYELAQTEIERLQALVKKMSALGVPGF